MTLKVYVHKACLYWTLKEIAWPSWHFHQYDLWYFNIWKSYQGKFENACYFDLLVFEIKCAKVCSPSSKWCLNFKGTWLCPDGNIILNVHVLACWVFCSGEQNRGWLCYGLSLWRYWCQEAFSVRHSDTGLSSLGPAHRWHIQLLCKVNPHSSFESGRVVNFYMFIFKCSWFLVRRESHQATVKSKARCFDVCNDWSES